MKNVKQKKDESKYSTIVFLNQLRPYYGFYLFVDSF